MKIAQAQRSKAHIEKGHARAAARLFPALCLALCLCISVVHSSWAKPRRIVSLNLCTDQLVLLLVEPERIASVTWMARDPAISTMPERAARVAINYGRAEEVMRAAPDLVVAGRYTYAPTLTALRRLAVPVELFELPTTLAEVRTQYLRMGDLLGEPDRAATALAELDRRLAAAGHAPGPEREAIILGAGGTTAGPGSLSHEVLVAAGYHNLAARLGIAGYGRISLEQLALSPPERLVFEPSYGDLPSLATERAHHPVLRHLGRRLQVPTRLWMCPSPGIAEAAERLADGRQ